MSRSRFVFLSVLFDAVLVNVGIVASFFVRFGGELPRFNFGAYVTLAPLVTVAYIATGYIFGLYEPERTEGAWPLVRAVVQAVTLAAILTFAIAFLGGPRFESFSRLVVLLAWPVNFALLVGWRLAVLRLTPIHWPEQRVLIVGVGSLAHELADELEKRSAWGYRVVGLLARDASERTSCEESEGRYPVLGTLSDIGRVVGERRVDRVIVASPVAVREIVEDMALSDESEVRVDVVPELYEIFIGSIDSVVADIPLMAITGGATPSWFVLAKRVFDVALAGVLLVVVSPVLALAGLAVLLTMGRPVLFTQQRVGKDLKPFDVIKLRTMVREAEKSTGPVLASADDVRVTPFGRLMRTYRVDELPQLVNILKGEMSFVGPRPERPFFVERYLQDIPGYRERFKVKPGVTGLAQVSGSYATTPARKLKYDLIYMYHQNLLLDAQVMVETLRVVLTGRGAR